MDWMGIVGLIASLITILALWSNIASMWFNWRHYKNGGVRITYRSGAYIIKSGNLDGKILFQSSKNNEDYKVYREMGMIETYEDIPKFYKWNMAHWADDIRVPNYPLQLL